MKTSNLVFFGVLVGIVAGLYTINSYNAPQHVQTAGSGDLSSAGAHQQTGH